MLNPLGKAVRSQIRLKALSRRDDDQVVVSAGLELELGIGDFVVLLLPSDLRDPPEGRVAGDDHSKAFLLIIGWLEESGDPIGREGRKFHQVGAAVS